MIETRHRIEEGMRVGFVSNAETGRKLTFQWSLDEHDAVFLGMGTYT